MYKVMIVDDEPLTLEYMRKYITLLDPRWEVVSEAMDGCEAFDLIKTNLIDLIITDIKMPLMDGLQLSKKVHEEYPNIQVVILSGHEEFELAKEAMKYGVKDYLLKPLVKSDLRNILINVAHHIEKVRNNEIAYKAMSTLSEGSINLVIKNFLKAIISESSVEIKTIYPILFQLKVSLIEFEGVILLLKVNEASLLKNYIQASEIPLFKFILSEVSTNIAQKNKDVLVFLDKDENTALLIGVNNKISYVEKCNNIFLQIFNEFMNKTGVSLSCGIGEPENDVLQLKSSYDKAYYALEWGLFYESPSLYTYKETNTIYGKKLTDIKNIIYSIQSGLLDNNETRWSLSLMEYVDNIKNINIEVAVKYGIYLLNSLKDTLPNISEEQLNDAFICLKTLSSISQAFFTREIVLTVFKNILHIIIKKYNDNTTTLSENQIVSKAKIYIYAHYSEAISLQQIADKISVSYSYLSSIFHKNEGESYIKFLTRVRMEEASKLLRKNPNIKIYDVSEKVGYVSVKHFSYIFKNYFNITPGEYLSIL